MTTGRNYILGHFNSTDRERINTHLLNENRNEETVIPKFIEVVGEFAEAIPETIPATLTFDGAIHEREILWSDDIIELDEDDLEPIEEGLTEEDVDALEFNSEHGDGAAQAIGGYTPSPGLEKILSKADELLAAGEWGDNPVAVLERLFGPPVEFKGIPLDEEGFIEGSTDRVTYPLDEDGYIEIVQADVPF